MQINILTAWSLRLSRRWRELSAFSFCVFLAGVALLASGFAAPAKLNAAQAATTEPHGQFLGVASCAGSTCHGRNEADGEVVRQDELMLWQEESTPGGAHSRAFRVLTEPRGRDILGRLRRASESEGDTINRLCVGCHATPVAGGGTGPQFQLAEGVTCEACHGPSGGWISSHYAVGEGGEGDARGATHARNLANGMRALEDPKTRAGVCLDCHFGGTDPAQFVTHEIMAAGHPRVSFELDLFSTLQQHHDEDGNYTTELDGSVRKPRTNNVRFWAVGQAVALDRSLSLFAKPQFGVTGMFPEFYFLDCHSCHRRIYDNESARPGFQTNPARPIPSGQPPYNDENMIMLSAAARVIAPDLAQQFEERSKAFHAAMAQGREPALAAAARLQQTAMALADRFSRADFSREQTFRVMETIAGEAISPRFTDYEGAVQSVMAIDTLLNGLVNQHGVSASSASALRVNVNQAYAAVAEPNSFKPAEFRRALGNAVRTIRNLR